ncbi:hypothetical protein J1614_001622, partial [Plenodomus biglobosus]
KTNANNILAIPPGVAIIITKIHHELLKRHVQAAHAARMHCRLLLDSARDADSVCVQGSGRGAAGAEEKRASVFDALCWDDEGSWDDVMRVIGQCHVLLHRNGVVRIQSDIRVGSRTDKEQSAEDKVAAVERLLREDEAH